MNSNDENMPFSGKIAVITSAPDTNEDDFYSADHLLVKYGAAKIVHVTWPVNFIGEQERVIDIIASLAADGEIKAIILNQAVPGSNVAVERLRKLRDDVFIVYCTVHEAPSKAASSADLLLMNDEFGMGPAIVRQAKKQGAKVFVHYSFPRHMSLKLPSGRRDLIMQACAAEGLLFVDAITPDPTEHGIDAARQAIMEDVLGKVGKYGEDTALFCTNCFLQAPLIKAVVDSHAIYPQPCCPSPYHGFPEALGIETGESLPELTYIINEACRIASEKNMTDRLSTWPVSASMMFTNAGAEYAINRIMGEAPKDGIDNDVLKECMSAYVREVVGEESNVYMKSYSENGVTYDNFKLILMSYLDF